MSHGLPLYRRRGRLYHLKQFVGEYFSISFPYLTCYELPGSSSEYHYKEYKRPYGGDYHSFFENDIFHKKQVEDIDLCGHCLDVKFSIYGNFIRVLRQGFSPKEGTHFMKTVTT